MKKWKSSLKRAGQFYPAPTTVNDKHPTADANFKISEYKNLASATALFTTHTRLIGHAQKISWSQENSRSSHALYLH